MARSFAFADLWELVAEQVPDREAVVCGERRLTYGELDERANRLADHLRRQGVGPGDHVGVYLTNGTEYLETMLAAYKLRAVPINVNYRYVEDELRYLFADAGRGRAVVHDAEFADRVAAIRDRAAGPRRRARRSGEGYEAALAAVDPARDFEERSSDDLYILYTGGTTGLPKGVVWRQEDAFHACIGGGDPDPPARCHHHARGHRRPHRPGRARRPSSCRWPPSCTPPGSGRACPGSSPAARSSSCPGSLEPDDVWRTIADEGVNLITIVGDAVARPLLDAWDEAGGYDVPTLFTIGSGGAPLSPALRRRIQASAARPVPGRRLRLVGDRGPGHGPHGRRLRRPGAPSPPWTTPRWSSTSDLQPVRARLRAPSAGWPARGHIPLRLPRRPREDRGHVRGARRAALGHHRRHGHGGRGRARSTCWGGARAASTPAARRSSPRRSSRCCGPAPTSTTCSWSASPDERWGERVSAIVQPAAGAGPTADELIEHCRAHLAGYKVPKYGDLRRPRRPVARGQARLPLGQGPRHDRLTGLSPTGGW